MSNKVALIVLSLALVGSMACKSEIDGKPAATVSEPTSEEAKALETDKTDEEAKAEPTVVAFSVEDSKIEWVGAKVTGDHDGGFKTWTGNAYLNADHGLEKVEFTVDTTSIYSDNERLTGHLKSDDFFDVEKYPEAKFVSTKLVERAEDDGTHTATGNMTMRGVTKEISFPVTVKADAGKLHVNSEFTIKRFDFKIAYEGKADDLIKDEVLLKLHLQAPLPTVTAEAAE